MNLEISYKLCWLCVQLRDNSHSGGYFLDVAYKLLILLQWYHLYQHFLTDFWFLPLQEETIKKKREYKKRKHKPTETTARQKTMSTSSYSTDSQPQFPEIRSSDEDLSPVSAKLPTHWIIFVFKILFMPIQVSHCTWLNQVYSLGVHRVNDLSLSTLLWQITTKELLNG